MSEAPKRGPLLLAGGGCVVCYGLVLVLLLVTVLVWRSSVASMIEQAQRERERHTADSRALDAFRAGLIARSGLDALLTDLSRGGAPPSPLKRALGSSYDHGEDRYEVRYSETGDGGYTIEVTGQVTLPEYRSYGSGDQRIVGECRLTARAKVVGAEVSVASLEARDTSPEPPPEGE